MEKARLQAIIASALEILRDDVQAPHHDATVMEEGQVLGHIVDGEWMPSEDRGGNATERGEGKS